MFLHSQVTVGSSKADGLFPFRDGSLVYQQVVWPWDNVITSSTLTLDSVLAEVSPGPLSPKAVLLKNYLLLKILEMVFF